MSPAELTRFLFDFLSFDADELDMQLPEFVAKHGITAEHFESAGMLTTDEGLVLRMRDGSEFTLTVQQRREAVR